jgi:hypothetical protein
MLGTDENILPLTGEETIDVSSSMMGADEKILPLTGEETIGGPSATMGADEKILATDGGSAEKTSEMSCTDLERLSFGGECEKMLIETTLGSC